MIMLCVVLFLVLLNCWMGVLLCSGMLVCRVLLM